jgi:tyrosyl-tRNA synthetase
VRKVECEVKKMQNGEAKLKSSFSDVRAVFYEDSLHVTDIEDLVEYLCSLSSFKDIMDLPVEKIRKVLREHIKDGAIDLPKDYGMFISK